MSKVLSDEEIIRLIVAWQKASMGSEPPKQLDVADLAMPVREAQRDSSDREWMLDLQIALYPDVPQVALARVEAVIRKHILKENNNE